jgi:hypothetical protein
MGIPWNIHIPAWSYSLRKEGGKVFSPLVLLHTVSIAYKPELVKALYIIPMVAIAIPYFLDQTGWGRFATLRQAWKRLAKLKNRLILESEEEENPKLKHNNNRPFKLKGR